MLPRLVRLALCFLSVGLGACDGCGARPAPAPAAEKPGEEPQADAPQERLTTVRYDADGGVTWEGIPLESHDLMLHERLIPLAGKEDFTNRYLSTVMVEAHFSDGKVKMCSGVAISHRLVLTSGHCVCSRQPSPSSENTGETTIDASACAATANVENVLYTPSASGNKDLADSTRETFVGSVRPHPQIHVVLDGQDQVVSSTADLAVITLKRPLGNQFQAFPLAAAPVQMNEQIVIVGYGYDETSQVFGTERRFSWNKVSKFLDSSGERVLIEQPGRHLYRLDSGGPCLREAAGRTELVGISSRNLGTGATFTSTYRYRTWLREEIRVAEKMASPARERQQRQTDP